MVARLLVFVLVGVEFLVVGDVCADGPVVLLVDAADGLLGEGVVGGVVPVDDFLVGLRLHVVEVPLVGGAGERLQVDGCLLWLVPVALVVS